VTTGQQRGQHAPQQAPQQRQLDYLFIVTYGRSGSTLLQGLLTSIPGFLIRGENGGAVYHLFKFHQTAAQARATHPKTGKPTNAWFGIAGFAEEQALTQVRRLVTQSLLRPGPETRVTGFKEIRWYQDDVADYVAFLQQAFPGARFVINTRNHESVARSDWWAQHADAPQRLAALEARFLQLAADLGDAAFHVHYDDYVADPTTLRGLYDWLGAEFDEQQVREVLARKHGY
jgi:hypothetical protein